MKTTCTCNNPGQDALHGKGVRIFNRTAKKRGDTFEHRCTVCGATRTVEGKKKA